MYGSILFGLANKNKSKITVEKDLTLVSLKPSVIIYFSLSLSHCLTLLNLCWGGANPIYSGFLFKLGLFL